MTGNGLELGLGLRQGTLALVPHDPRWAEAFADWRDAIWRVVPPGMEIHHIGSTAVLGLAAKPILDIAVAAPWSAHRAVSDGLHAAGWIPRGERSGVLFIRMHGDIRTHNLNLYPLDAAELTDQLTFRDRLRADPELRRAYAAEKRAIIAGGTPRGAYAEAKTAFIDAALGRRA